MIDKSGETWTLAPALAEPTSESNEAPLGVRLVFAWVRWSFLLFVFSIPFEAMDLLGVAETFSLAKFFALQFLLAALLRSGWTFARPARPFWFFLGYLAACMILGIGSMPRYGDEVIGRLLTLVQLLLVFWIGVNVLRDENAFARALTTFGISCALVVALRMTGVAFSALQYGEFVRVSAFNQNPNSYALTLAFGVLALLGRTRLPDFPLRLPLRVLFWVLAAALLLEILETGARGATAALLAGLLVLYGMDGPVWLRAVKWVLIVAALGVAFLGPLGSDTSRNRWEETFSEGDTAHRDRIYSTAAEMGLERPFFGWGPVAHLYELGRRLRWPEGYRDTHNDFLWVWNEVGLVGLVPFLFGVGLWLKAAWQARGGPWRTVPLALLTFVLLSSMSESLHFTKLFWLGGMFAVAAAVTVRADQPEPEIETAGDES